VFTRQFVEQNPEQVQAMVDSWFATLDYIKTNTSQAYEIMSNRAGVTLEEYKDYADGTKLFTIEENLRAFQEGNDMTSLYFSAREMSKFLVEVGLADQEADLSRIFDDRFVKTYAKKHSG
jgi:NitT/TauT family transport system substrate-binding protein